MVVLYDPFYEAPEHPFSDDIECGECGKLHLVTGVGFVDKSGGVWCEWDCPSCDYRNGERFPLFELED